VLLHGLLVMAENSVTERNGMVRVFNSIRKVFKKKKSNSSLLFCEKTTIGKYGPLMTVLQKKTEKNISSIFILHVMKVLLHILVHTFQSISFINFQTHARQKVVLQMTLSRFQKNSTTKKHDKAAARQAV
jgi:hypothetical protein